MVLFARPGKYTKNLNCTLKLNCTLNCTLMDEFCVL